MRDKNKETARRMLLPSSNRPESPAEAFATVSAPSAEEYVRLRWGHPAPDSKRPAYAKCHESSWDSVARPMITWQQIAEPTAIPDTPIQPRSGEIHYPSA
jgi:hypothetical protein